MRELTEELLRWHAAGKTYAVASIVGITGSAPRLPGAAMAVNDEGVVIGSISGGCVEGAVYELCREALRTGRPQRETFGYSDSDAFAVGLTCGGALEVLVHPIGSRDHATIETVLRSEGAVALVRDVSSGAVTALGPDWATGAEFDGRVVAEARAMLDLGSTGVRVIGCGAEEVTVFIESHVPPPRMIVFGAIDFAAAVARIGKFLGYHVTVCDARPVFATAARFPEADEVVVDWPHRYLEGARVDSRTVICVLTHDAKFDVPVLEVALRRSVAYVGAMGSRRTHTDRLARLRAAGLTEGELAQLRSPIGLDLGGHTPEETAVAVAAEIVAVRRGGSGRSLATSDGPIHRYGAHDSIAPPPMEFSAAQPSSHAVRSHRRR
ncbi:XdhC family protein [Nocardia pseudobrasiliensis]|uniref:Xanthine dehydrogenase accessory factor n=1 Tax=Nocardia pseudobrasiliensis TaxID=45979 RepID=A0A370I1R3_9NOCA|nr:XdhC/CoxI family protein [Nocardia pseudobrasiliensis]RDI64111.1 xanthine dehydrogenase accessory factor [Nocardia pseudobrasiliensis]